MSRQTRPNSTYARMPGMNRPPPPVRDPGQLDPSVPWRGVPWGWGLAAQRRKTQRAAPQAQDTGMPSLFGSGSFGEGGGSAPVSPGAAPSTPAPTRATPPLPPGAKRRLKEQRERLAQRCEAQGVDPHDLVPDWKGYQGSSPRQLWALEQALGPALPPTLPRQAATPSEQERQLTREQGEAWLR